MNGELSAALTTVLVALCGVVATVVGVLGSHGARYLRKLLELRTAELEAQHARTISLAADAGVAAAEEAGRKYQGSVNKGELARTVARNLAPRATASLPDYALTDVVQASVSKMRASQPSASLMPPSLAPGTTLSIPVVVSDSGAPTIPLAPRMPTLEQDGDTRPARPGAR